MASSSSISKAEIHAQALKLRHIRFKHAGAIANQARIIAMAANNLLKIESKIHEESIPIAGENYQRYHVPSFDEAEGSMQEQFENGGFIKCPGFLDIKNCATQVVTVASAVAAAAKSAPPPLPYEEEFIIIENEND